MEHFMCPQMFIVCPMQMPKEATEILPVGDYLTFYLKVKDSRIEKISYLVFGCCASIGNVQHDIGISKG